MRLTGAFAVGKCVTSDEGPQRFAKGEGAHLVGQALHFGLVPGVHPQHGRQAPETGARFAGGCTAALQRPASRKQLFHLMNRFEVTNLLN